MTCTIKGVESEDDGYCKTFPPHSLNEVCTCPDCNLRFNNWVATNKDIYFQCTCGSVFKRFKKDWIVGVVRSSLPKQ